MKEYHCVLEGHHKYIDTTIQQYLKNGWHLHTYQASAKGFFLDGVNHYLLFERDSEKDSE